MMTGGICSKGLTRLILVQNTINKFAYAQAILFFKEIPILFISNKMELLLIQVSQINFYLKNKKLF